MSNLIVLVGYMGSGKSTLGRHLAHKFSYNFFDLDELIEQKAGLTIPEIFKKQGVIYFRKLENEVLKSALLENLNTIIAVGGGTPCYYDNMKMINENSISIYLRATVPQLALRLFPERENRPLIKDQETVSDLQEFIGKHLFERNAFYNEAQATVDVGSLTVNEAVNRCVQVINQLRVAE